MIFIGKRDDVSHKTIFMQGSFIYRNIEKFIKPQYIKPIMVLSYLGVSCFIIAVFGGLISYII